MAPSLNREAKEEVKVPLVGDPALAHLAVGVASWGQLLWRGALLLAGLGLGAILLMPDAMMSDSGSPRAVAAAKVGMTACATLALGGLYGAATGSASVLLLGILLQALSLAIFALWPW
jgi:hypothetical protein